MVLDRLNRLNHLLLGLLVLGMDPLLVHLVMGLALWLALNNHKNLDHALEKQK
jgi:hypothetical protein